MKQLHQTEDGVADEDGVITLRDGREVAWRWWGEPGGTPLLRIQGTPSSRLQRNPNPSIRREVGARYLMADRPGYGGSTRKPGRGIADIADDYIALLDHFGLDRVPAMGTSGGGPPPPPPPARHPHPRSAAGAGARGAPPPARTRRPPGPRHTPRP